jgi:hypothetical protein
VAVTPFDPVGGSAVISWITRESGYLEKSPLSTRRVVVQVARKRPYQGFFKHISKVQFSRNVE